MHRSLVCSTQSSKRILSNLVTQQYNQYRLVSRYYSSTASPINDLNSNNEFTKPSQSVLAMNTPDAPLQPLQSSTIQQRTKETNRNQFKRDSKANSKVVLQHIQSNQLEKAFNTLVEMVNEDVQYSVEDYNALLRKLSSKAGAPIQAKIVQLMEKQQVPLTAISCQHVLKGLSWGNQVSVMVEYLDSMKKKDLEPTLFCYGHIISSCLRANEPTTALRLLKEVEATDLPLKKDPRLLMDVLRVSALNDHIEGTLYSWNKAVVEFALRPDEGSCLQVLRLAAKEGDSDLATKVIQQLSDSGYSYKEHYFVPLMEAFVTQGQLENAFEVLDIMREADVIPTARTTLSISNKLSTNIEMVDKAYYVLEEMKKEGKQVDVAAFNTVVFACGLAKDIGRMVATYREAGNLGVVPDVDTFNAVLEACIQTETKRMGQVVFDELKKAKVTPNKDTFSKMITLVCKESNYEDAFVYLEEMKSRGITPPRYSYIILATKLAREKDTRFHLALEEMVTYGYRPSDRLKSLWY